MNTLIIRFVIVAFVAVVFILGGFWVLGLIREDASRDTIDIINQQNKEAGNVGESTRLSYRDCVARGLRFDFEHSRCLGD